MDLANLFDSQGNYKFCHSCILAWIDVHAGMLARLRKVKRQQHQQPLQQMTKAEARTMTWLHAVRSSGKGWQNDTVEPTVITTPSHWCSVLTISKPSWFHTRGSSHNLEVHTTSPSPLMSSAL